MRHQQKLKPMCYCPRCKKMKTKLGPWQYKKVFLTALSFVTYKYCPDCLKVRLAELAAAGV